jgi:hypothetical protein
LRFQAAGVGNLRMQDGEHNHHTSLGQPIVTPSLVLPNRTGWSWWGRPVVVAAAAAAVYTPCSSCRRRHALVLLLSLPLAVRTFLLSSISRARSSPLESWHGDGLGRQCER